MIKLDPSTTSVIATCTDCPYWYAFTWSRGRRGAARDRARGDRAPGRATTCEIGSPAASRRAARDRPVRRCDTRLRSIVSMGILDVLTGRTHGLMSSSVSLPVVSPYSPTPQLPQIVLTEHLRRRRQEPADEPRASAQHPGRLEGPQPARHRSLLQAAARHPRRPGRRRHRRDDRQLVALPHERRRVALRADDVDDQQHDALRLLALAPRPRHPG